MTLTGRAPWLVLAVLMVGIVGGYMASGRLRSNGAGEWCVHYRHIVICSPAVWVE